MRNFFKNLFPLTLYKYKRSDSYLSIAGKWLYNSFIGSLNAVGYFLHGCTGHRSSLKEAWNNLANGPLAPLQYFSLVSPFKASKTKERGKTGEEKIADGKEVQAELGQVPKILEYMGVSKGDQDNVVQASKLPQYKGKFFGEIAVDLGIIKQNDLEKALGEQDILKAKAAHDDIAQIAAGNKVTFPGWMKPHWGNNNAVNDVSFPITTAVSSAAAANAAQLIVLLVGNNPELAKKHQKSVEKLAYITEGILEKKPGQSFNEAIKGLNNIKQSILQLAQDKDLAEQYVENRFQEIEAVLNLDKGQGLGQGRQ